MDHVVHTRNGRVRGLLLTDDIVAFRGIPYAGPPTGAARFRAPVPPTPWHDIRDATRFGPVSPQSNSLPGAPTWSPDDEAEYLSVNVWAPRNHPGPLPVLVWIHGGAYLFGTAAEPLYEASALARAGLVVVSLNYRLGFEGFGHVPSRPDNRGFLDQVAALRWVRDNIAEFGGDPDNVTVSGQSAGAGSVAALLTMPSARGLFTRAIAHSAPSDFRAVDHAREVTERVGAALGVPPEPGALSDVPPEALIKATGAVVAHFRGDRNTGFNHYVSMPYAPVLDGEVLPENPLRAIAAGAARDTDLLVCHTLHEWTLFTALESVSPVEDEEGLRHAAVSFGLGEDAVDGYRALLPDASPFDLYNAIAGDGLFSEYSMRIGEEHARAGGRTFLSRFTWESPALDGALRACHGLDLTFVFGKLDSGQSAFFLDGPSTDRHRDLSERMIHAWADFAAHGDPGWAAAGPDCTPVRIWDMPVDLRKEDRDGGVRALWREVSF